MVIHVEIKQHNCFQVSVSLYIPNYYYHYFAATVDKQLYSYLMKQLGSTIFILCRNSLSLFLFFFLLKSRGGGGFVVLLGWPLTCIVWARLGWQSGSVHGPSVTELSLHESDPLSLWILHSPQLACQVLQATWSIKHLNDDHSLMHSNNRPLLSHISVCILNAECMYEYVFPLCYPCTMESNFYPASVWWEILIRPGRLAK